MSITKLIGVLGLMVALGVAVSYSTADDKKPAPPLEVKAQPASAGDAKMAHFMDCAKECDDCARTCNGCAAHCTKMVAEGKKDHMETVRLCVDCATICSAASAVVSKFGPCSDLICAACADTCKRCGDACEKHAAHDEIMKKCHDECVKCEKACREMLKHTAKAEK